MIRAVTVGGCLAAALTLAACDDLTGPRWALTLETIEAGGQHSCGVFPGGAVYCWGEGERGQLGDGEMSRSPWPVRAGGPGAFTQLALGQHHSCGLIDTGHLRCWGWNRYGQLGTGSNNTLSYPTEVYRGENYFSRVTAGWHHTCALTTTGEAYCWGYNALGQLGDGTIEDARLPVRVGADQDLHFMDIAAGGMHTCALATDGSAYCWGLNFLGQLGTGDQTNTSVPTPVEGGVPYASITAGVTHSCALTANGIAHCWGSNTYGELGNQGLSNYFEPGSVRPAPVFQAVFGGILFTQISAGRDVTCAIDPAGSAYCWGAGVTGQLGSNELRNWSLPRRVVARRDMRFTHVSVGSDHHVCGVTATLMGFCWGESRSGALGPRFTFSSQPVEVPPARNR